MSVLVRAVGGASVLLLLAVAFTPLADRLARWTGVAPRLAGADAIVVLGTDTLPDGTLSPTSLRRTVHGIRLHRRGLAPLLVFSGPPTDGSRADEPAVRAALAEELGVAPEAIVTVPAWTTAEEAEHSRARLTGRDVRRILLVSEAGHLRRAGPLFEREGFAVFPAPADGEPVAETPEARLHLMRAVLEEALARLLYRAAGGG